jgi:hypothetical protein
MTSEDSPKAPIEYDRGAADSYAMDVQPRAARIDSHTAVAVGQARVRLAHSAPRGVERGALVCSLSPHPKPDECTPEAVVRRLGGRVGQHWVVTGCTTETGPPVDWQPNAYSVASSRRTLRQPVERWLRRRPRRQKRSVANFADRPVPDGRPYISIRRGAAIVEATSSRLSTRSPDTKPRTSFFRDLA